MILNDVTLGRKGLLGYLKALGGSNVTKVTPSNGSASGSQANGHKRLKVICGANTSYLADMDWIGEKTPLTLCQVRVSPSNSVKPNIGTAELAETLSRLLPFTARDDNRPVLQCVNLVAKGGKLTLVSADGFRLAVIYHGLNPVSLLKQNNENLERLWAMVDRVASGERNAPPIKKRKSKLTRLW